MRLKKIVLKLNVPEPGRLQTGLSSQGMKVPVQVSEPLGAGPTFRGLGTTNL